MEIEVGAVRAHFPIGLVDPENEVGTDLQNLGLDLDLGDQGGLNEVDGADIDGDRVALVRFASEQSV